MNFRAATHTDIPHIHRLAEATWWPTYTGILAPEQIAFMLDDMYTETALESQFATLDFYLAERDGSQVAFAALSPAAVSGTMKLQKLYILPSEQGRGTGKGFLNFLEAEARRAGAHTLELNVHRKNPALAFYRKQGFSIQKEVDISYHQFVLTDYVMRKSITQYD